MLQPISPRLATILSMLSLEEVESVRSCEQALSMDPDTFGQRTEEAREMAQLSYAEPQRQTPAPPQPPPPETASDLAVFSWLSSSRLTPGSDTRSGISSATVVDNTTFTRGALANFSGSCVSHAPTAAHGSGAIEHWPASQRLHPGSTALRCQAGTSSEHWSRKQAGCSAIALRDSAPQRPPQLNAPESTHDQLLASNLAEEDREARLLAERLVNATPPQLMFHQASGVPMAMRRANRLDHLCTCGVSSLQKGLGCMMVWLDFCERHSIPDYGAGIVDEEMLSWCLRELDAAARARAKGDATGGHMKHATAGAFRWLSDNAGCPFGAAKGTAVRKASRPSREKEPAYSEMWEVAVIIHLLRILVFYRGPNYVVVRQYAWAAYLVAAASLRLIDMQRSPPVVLRWTRGRAAFHSTAALSKGKRRSSMAPRPWCVPAVSPDATITDAQLMAAAQEAAASLPGGATSMFPKLLDRNGALSSLPKATQFGTTRSTPARIATGVAYLLTWAPLAYSPPRAKEVAKKKHGPRHTLAEVSRVACLPKPARDLVGFWKGGQQKRICLRECKPLPWYSREAEVVMQTLLRTFLLRYIKQCSTIFVPVPLEHFTAAMTAVFSSRVRCRTR